MTNASIAAELMALAQFLAASGDDPFKVRAYRRAATTIRTFDINSSPDRSDLSANHGRLARQAGVKVAITTDAHSRREFANLRYGVYQARRAGFMKEEILNHLPWSQLEPILKR